MLKFNLASGQKNGFGSHVSIEGVRYRLYRRGGGRIGKKPGIKNKPPLPMNYELD